MPSRKVAALTAEQLDQFRVVRDELLAAAVGTNPADRPAAEAAICRMYELSGLRPPRFIWCESPAAAHVALRVLAVDRTWLTPKVSRWSYDPSPVAYPQPLTRCHYPRAVGYLDGRPYADGAEALRSALERSLGAKQYLALPMRQDVGMLERLLQHAVYDIPLRTIDGVIGNSARASLENSLPKVAWPASGKRQKPVGWDPGDRWVSAIASGVKHYLAPDAFRGLHSGQHHSQLVNFEAPRRLGLVSYGAPGNEWLDCWCTLARSCGWFWPFERVCVAAERPAIVRVEEVPGAKSGPIVPHCPDGPAIVFPDGWEVHAWHGTGVPASLVEDEWDFKRILAERNVETRRCAIEKLGWEELERHLVPVASAPDPGNPGQVLTLCELPREIAEACGRARLLLCSNGTPEADGTRRRFGLLVPARHTDPVAAAAQTYGWSRRRYASLARRT